MPSRATSRRRAAGSARAPVLSARALNRATLARQLLLDRSACSPLEAVERLVGLQGQVPRAPFIGLWSRLPDFRLDDLDGLVTRGQVVRATAMRGTLHLLAATDYRWIRPLLQPLLVRLQRAFMGRQTDGLDLSELVDHATGLLAEQPLTRTELRKLLGRRWPDRDPSALLHSVQYLLPLVHLPPAGTWGGRVNGPCALAESWSGRPAAGAGPEALVSRYLAAFGPAGVPDVQAWSGLTWLAEVVDGMRPQLRVFADEHGGELFDLPDAPRPDPDVPAPPRLLPEYDNLLLAHADRTRVISDQDRKRVITPAVAGTLLVDGVVRGTWTVARAGRCAVLRMRTFGAVPATERSALVEEAGRLITLVEPDAPDRDVDLTVDRLAAGT